MSLLSLFSSLTDPRVARTRRYPLGDLLLVVLCGLLCGADSYVAICRWATARKGWLQERFGITAIPSHDTLGRVLSRLDSPSLAQILAHWNQALWQAGKAPGTQDRDGSSDEIIAFDAKRIKGAANALNLPR